VSPAGSLEDLSFFSNSFPFAPVPVTLFDDPAVLDHVPGVLGDEAPEPAAPVLPDCGEDVRGKKRLCADQSPADESSAGSIALGMHLETIGSRRRGSTRPYPAALLRGVMPLFFVSLAKRPVCRAGSGGEPGGL